DSKQFGWWLAILVVTVLGLAMAWASFWSLQSLRALKASNLAGATLNAQRALPVVQHLSGLTLGLVPDLVVWHEGLWLLAHLESIKVEASESLELSPDEDRPSLAQVLDEPLLALENLNREVPRTVLVRHLLSDEQQTQLSNLTTTARLLKEKLMNGDRTWLIVFQNSQELRATGGFMGSLAFITLKNGSVTNIDVQDIYQPAGQLKVAIEPPAGVKEYLSGGKNWQLTDANWSPDFPTAAQTVTEMLEKSGYPTIHGVIAINLDMARSLLAVTGPVNVPDYQTQVTSDNLAEVLRSNRDQFFAGSLAKQHLLASFVTQLKNQLLDLPVDQQLAALKLIVTETHSQNLQLWARSPDLQALFTDYQVAGEQLPLSENPQFFLDLVESNVGINKANQGVERSWQLDIQPTQTQVTVKFNNANQASDRPQLSPQAHGARHLHYVNYQRVY
ncbi:MAG: DUF4012 domain-containing protein, partial [Candidatus Doudnabacteria bacterium]|nr:DUF4012 domain-containing protein [Candidatus Doudnabacteria bacterium]